MDKTKIHLGIISVDTLRLREIYRRRCKELDLLPNLKSGRRAMEQVMLAAICSSPHYPGINALLDDLEPDLEDFKLVATYRDRLSIARKLFEEDREKAFSDLRSRANENSTIVVEYKLDQPHQDEILQFGISSDTVACLRVIAPRTCLPKYTILNGLEQAINRDPRSYFTVKAVNFEDYVHSQPENTTQLVYGRRISSFEPPSLREMLRKKPKYP